MRMIRQDMGTNYMARVEAKAELTLRFSTIPGPLSVRNAPALVQFDVFVNSTRFLIKMKRSRFDKAFTQAKCYQSWNGTIKGRLGEPIEGGFEILDAGIQLFEKLSPQSSVNTEIQKVECKY
jgi:hypothetical protein